MGYNRLKKAYYRNSAGKEPAREFIASLDIKARMRVFAQIDRLKEGNSGSGHGVGGISELRIDYGPGYRVYYVIVQGLALILLLTAGDKSTQREDVKQAKKYYADYKKRTNEAGDEEN
ncbi:type II toxin-antitoxin system RelE/ParE family toxin [Bdellovibrio sp. HCB290]|uniref:type II toxin-antitoxin system RelE/ParE family toxin n=1 Tax=Bdellovibrio sp. HCB290 TaxID=3394356 RepID=UPI0039B37FF4